MRRWIVLPLPERTESLGQRHPRHVLRALLHLEAARLEEPAAALRSAREVTPLPADLRDAFALAEEETGRSFVEAAWINRALEAVENAARKLKRGR